MMALTLIPATAAAQSTHPDTPWSHDQQALLDPLIRILPKTHAPQDLEACATPVDCYNMAGRLREGSEQLEADFERAVALYAINCQKNEDLPSCVSLAEMLYFGKGLPKDEIQAHAILYNLCQQDSFYACTSLDTLSTFARAPHYHIEPVHGYYEASARDCPQAQACFDLAEAHRPGGGSSDRDFRRALSLHSINCADNHDMRSCMVYGQMVFQGQGTEKDPTTGHRILLETCQMGYGDACELIDNAPAAERQVIVPRAPRQGAQPPLWEPWDVPTMLVQVLTGLVGAAALGGLGLGFALLVKGDLQQLMGGLAVGVLVGYTGGVTLGGHWMGGNGSFWGSMLGFFASMFIPPLVPLGPIIGYHWTAAPVYATSPQTSLLQWNGEEMAFNPFATRLWREDGGLGVMIPLMGGTF